MAFQTPEIDHTLAGQPLSQAPHTSDHEHARAELDDAARRLAATFQRTAGQPEVEIEAFLVLGWLLALFEIEHFPKGNLCMRLRNVTPDAVGFRRFVRPFLKAAPWGRRHMNVARALDLAEKSFE